MAIIGFLMIVVSGTALAGSLFMTGGTSSGGANDIQTQVDYDATFTTETLQINAGTSIALATSSSGTTRSVTISVTGMPSSFTGDVGGTSQQYLNNSTATAGGAVQVRDVLELNNAGATTPVTMTAAATTLTIDVNGTGNLVMATGDGIVADTATIASITADAVFTDRVSARTAGQPLKLRETVGVQISDDTETANTISTLTPSANTLTLAIAGAGTLTLDATDTLVAGAATITSLQYTTALGTNSITTNNTATTLFVTNVRPRTYGVAQNFLNSAGWVWGGDAGDSTATWTVQGGATTALNLALGGSGVFTLSGDDKFQSNVLEGTTIGATVTLQGNTTGGVKIDSLSGYTEFGSGDVVQMDAIETITSNTTLTLLGKGQGVSLGGRVRIDGLAGGPGAEANGNLALRVNGSYQGIPIATAMSERIASSDLTDFSAAKTGTGASVVSNTGPTIADINASTYVAWTDQAADSASSGRTQRNGTNLSHHDGTAARFLQLRAAKTLATTCTVSSSNTASGGSTGLVNSCVFTADAAVLTNGTNETVVFGVSVTVDKSAASSANGRDQAGAFSDDTWVYGYIIDDDNPNGGQPVAGIWSLSSSAPTLPTNYTRYCLVTAANTGSSSRGFYRFYQDTSGLVLYVDDANLRLVHQETSSSATSYTAIDLNAGTKKLVPPTARSVNVTFGIVSGTAGNFMGLNSDGDSTKTVTAQTAYVTSVFCNRPALLPCTSDQKVFYKTTNSADDTYLYVDGYRR